MGPGWGLGQAEGGQDMTRCSPPGAGGVWGGGPGSNNINKSGKKGQREVRDESWKSLRLVARLARKPTGL